MSVVNATTLALISLAVVAGGWWVAARFFSAEARWERRRRRSHAPIAGKRNRTAVKLSARTKSGRRK